MKSYAWRVAVCSALAALAASCADDKPSAGAAGGSALDRTVLPIHEPAVPTYKELDAREAKAPPRFEVRAPDGAPNVVIVLIDDMGFGQPSTFGGAVAMPTLDRLAAGGLRYTNMHVTALCSPTRAALLTGRNHHTNNTGAVQDIATAFDGYTGVRPASVAPLAEMLRLNGYNTEPVTPIGIMVLSVVIALLVSLGATFGGTLVYDYGFNVETAGDSPVWHKSETDVLPGRQKTDGSA